MSRDEFLHRYKTDPLFRLNRLMKLRARNYKRQGGFPSSCAYEKDIEKAKAEILALMEDTDDE